MTGSGDIENHGGDGAENTAGDGVANQAGDGAANQDEGALAEEDPAQIPAKCAERPGLETPGAPRRLMRRGVTRSFWRSYPEPLTRR